MAHVPKLKFARKHLGNVRKISYRILPLLLVVSLLVSLVSFGLPVPALAQHEGEQTAKFLPADTDLYFTINLDPSSNQLSKFRRVLNNWWQDPNVQAKWGKLLGQIGAESNVDIEEDVFPWLGPEIAMGMRDMAVQYQYDEEPEVIIFAGTMDKEASDACFEKYKTWREAEGASIISGPYRGMETITIEEWGEYEYYALTNEYILLSNREAAIERTIDFVLDGGASLAGTSNFQAARSALPERVGMLYCNYEHIWDEIIQATPEEQQAGLTPLGQLMKVFSGYVPSYFAASLYFTDKGISTTAYSPLPEGIALPTEPNLLKSANIVPGNALLFASDQNVNAYWQGLKPCLQATWLELVSNLLSQLMVDKFGADIFEMPLEEVIAYLDKTLELNLDEFWAGIAPYLDELSGMTFKELIAYLDESLSLNLDELWTQVAPYLDELSGMTFEEVIAYLDEDLGLNLDEQWEKITPVLGELSEMGLEELIAYLDENLGLNLDELWTEIVPYLGELSRMSFAEAITYLDETLNLNLEEWWAVSPVAGKIFLPGMTFEEAVAYLGGTFGKQWAEIALHLGELSGKSFEAAVAYLDENLGLNFDELWEQITPVLEGLSSQETFAGAMAYLAESLGLNLDELWAEIAPVLGELSEMSFEEAVAHLDEVLGLNLANLWDEQVASVLAELSSQETFVAAVTYLDETLCLNLEELWAAISSMIEQLALESFEEATACFNQMLTGMTGEFSMALLPISFEQIPDILLMFQVEDATGVQQNLNDIVTTLDPWYLQASEVSLDGVTATMFTDYYIAESGASPGYLFLDADTTHYLVVGSTEEALRAAVEASQGSVASLNEAEEYQGVLSLLPEDKIDLGYLNITELLNTIVSQIPTEGMTEEEMAYFELFLDCIPVKSALAYCSALADSNAVTMTGAFYLLPPPLVEQLIEEGTTGLVEIPEKIIDFTQLDLDVGRVAIKIAVDIIQAPAGSNIKVTAMKELPEEVSSGFELVATDAQVSIVDVAYGIRVDKANLAADNVGTATITMKVGRTWADNYGVDNVKIFRRSNGTCEVLPTEFVGYEDDLAVFRGTSEEGLSTFGLVAVSALPSAFTLSNLSITPSEVKAGEDVTITLSIANGSIARGTHTVTLKINGEVVETKEVTVSANSSETVSFTVTRDTAGTYSVEIDGLSGSFTVLAEEAPLGGMNWALIGGIIGGVIVVAAIVALLFRRRRAM